MTGREWEPSAVARIHCGEFDDIALRLDPRDWATAGGTVRDVSVELAYPLAVIDPEDRGLAERLLRAYLTAAGGICDHQHPPRFIDAMQAALRGLAAPPKAKPDEPTGLGAVVEDASGVEYVHLGFGLWAYGTTDGLSKGFTYADIAAVRVLSEGSGAVS